jgi:hypothetical protein
VEDRWLVERFVIQPKRHSANPLIEREHPWEGSGPHMGGSVIRDPDTGRFTMWYTVWNKHAYENHLPFSYNVCYAESEDGITWRKPALNVFDHEGSAENNCIRLGTDKTQNIDVCLNPDSEVYPGKFLAIHNQKGGVFVSHSDDGRIFTRLSEEAAIPYHSDTHNNFVFDEVRDRWLLFCRPRAYAGYHKRRVALQTSRDLVHWTHERTILIPTETEIPEYYGMTVFRRGDLFFGVVQIYDRTNGDLFGELAWSGDGLHWDLLPSHPPFLQLGPPDSWDAGMVLVAETPVDVGDEMLFYYGGFRLNHNVKVENVASIGLMTAERDRLVGVRQSTDEPGFIMTRPFSPRGEHLTVNAKVRGRLSAELRTDGNETIRGWSLDDCDPLVDTGFSEGITWRGRRMHEVPDDEVRVLFRLEDVELFTFDLTESPVE